MRIALFDVTVTVSFGGIQTAVWELARALHDGGHQVSVFGGTGTIRPDLGGREISVHTFGFTPRDEVLDLGSRFRRIWERWSFASQALPTLVAGNFDWVILTKPFDFFLPWRMPGGRHTRFCFMSGGTDFFLGDRRLGSRVDAWVACSHFNAWQISHHYKRFPQVMFNGVDVGVFSPGAREAGLREQLGFASDDVVFAFAGRLVGWKGLAVVIKALADPALIGLPIKLLLIGDGDARAELAELAAHLGVAERVVFQAPVPHRELPKYYAAVDGGIFPSIGDEAFGITIAEAMACGLPVVASHIGGIPEVVGNEGTCGLLVPAGDVAGFARAMAGLAADSAYRQCLGAAGSARIRQNFTWALAAQRLLHTLIKMS